MFKRTLYVLLFLIISIVSFSQDPTFSQFYANPLYLAPSFAGSAIDYRFSLNYRNQWPAINNVYTTYAMSLDKYFANYNSGLGILATYDVAGSANLSNTVLGINYSYDFNLTQNWHMRPGMSFKVRYLGIDISKLIFNSQLPGSAVITTPIYDSKLDVDLSSSVLLYNDMSWYGITVDHMLTPTVSFYGTDADVPIKVNIFGGSYFVKKTRLISKKPKDNFLFAFNFQTQANFYQTDLGVYYNADIFVLGLWYRGIPFVSKNQIGDAIIGLVGIKWDKLQIGYSYDFTISSLALSTAGSHEISITYKFSYFSNPANYKIKALPCPEF